MDRGTGGDYIANRIQRLERRAEQLTARSPLPLSDRAGIEMLGLDEVAGWGLRNPTLDVVMYNVSPDVPTVPSAAWVTLYQGFFTVLHPRLYLASILVTKGAASVAGMLQWVVDSPSMTGVTTTTATLTGVGAVQDTQTVDFAASDEGQLCQLGLQVQMSGTVAAGNVAFAYPLLAWRVRSTYPN
jgi:hypothetical protein